MGKDGAAGLLRLRQHGAATMAQSEATCVVYGMPGEAVRIGAAKSIQDLQNIAGEVERHARRLSVRAAEVVA
jgi:two-component system, chemotaxis family, protein-glutamate methylesterase/glutaminase